MAKAGLVDVVATEDMDALTFGAPRLVRNMMNPASKDDAGAREYEYTKVGGGAGVVCVCEQERESESTQLELGWEWSEWV